MALVLLCAVWTPLPDLVVHSIMVALAVCGLLVVAGTRARHPGGFALLGISLMVWWAQGAAAH